MTDETRNLIAKFIPPKLLGMSIMTNQQAKQCARISIEYAIEQLQELMPDFDLPTLQFQIKRQTMMDALGLRIIELQKQLSEL